MFNPKLMNKKIKMKENDNDKIPFTNFDIDESKMRPLISHQQLKDIKQAHDEHDQELLDQLNMQTKQITEGQKMMKNILQKEKPLLEQVDQDMDRVENKMKMENNRLKLYLEKTSTNFLYWVIGIELFILFLLFMM